jgi:UDP-glucose:(heptosyl)LPS alpha-1,3-glucosyltransferase
LRIAFIKQKYVEAGGGEQYLSRLMRACARQGDEIHLITTEWLPLRDLPITTHIIPRGRISLAARAARFSANAAAVIGAGNFDVSFSLERTAHQDVWRAGEGVHRIWLERRRLMEPGLSSRLHHYSPRHSSLLRLERECVRNTPRIIANSRMVAADLRRVYGDTAGEIEVIHNGVDPAQFNTADCDENRHRIRVELGIESGCRLLLMVGSGLERKGLRETMLALRGIPDCLLAVIGREQSEPWRRRAAKLGLAERVLFLKPRNDLKPYFHAADLALLPSWFDPFPNAGLEALFCGTPLISSAFAGVSEVLREGDSGEIVALPSDIAALAGGIERQLEMGLDLERRQRISASVGHLTIERNRDETLRVLRAGKRGR